MPVPDGYIAAMPEAQLATGAVHLFDVDGEPRLIIASGEYLRAFDGLCTHEDADLADGDLEDTTLWCPFHNSGFDITDGHAVCPPATEPLPRYDVLIHDGTVYVAHDPMPTP